LSKVRDSGSLKWARVALVAVGVVTLLVGAGSAFEPGNSDDQVLIATFGAGMGFFAIALALIAFGDRNRLAWAVLWYYPVFFAVHVAAFGTWVPDLPLLVVAAAALLASRQGVLGRSSDGPGRALAQLRRVREG
jgi:hypothetical protein